MSQQPENNPAYETATFHADLDSLFSQIATEAWVGSIRFPLDKGATGTAQTEDLCLHFKKTMKEAGWLPKRAPPELHRRTRRYFDINKYPPPKTQANGKLEANEDPSYTKLKLDLETASFHSGSPVMCNGSSNTGRDKVFKCSFKHRVYKKGKNALDSEYRKDALVNSDKEGRRPQGQELSRRPHTKLALPGECTCKFRFAIAWDNFGFYLKQITGCNTHTGHPETGHQDLALPGRLLPNPEREAVIHMARSSLGAAIGRNYVWGRIGRFLPMASIRYIQEERLPKLDKNDPRQLPANDVEGLLRFFDNAQDISYQVLWDVPTIRDDDEKEHILVSTRYDKDGKGEVTSETTEDHSSEEGMADLHQEVSAARASASIQPQDKVFLCVAWANKEELTLIQRFTSLMYCDATSDTNKNLNHLVTFSSRTPDGKQFIFLRVWIHNQKRATFKWIFQVVLKSFIPSEFHPRVQMVLVDGDPQQMNELRVALESYLVNAKFTTCGYHLITLGFTKGLEIRKPRSKKNRKIFDSFSGILIHWLYSFMRPGHCETKEEYMISKRFLFAWLRSKEVLDVLGETDAKTCREWVRSVLAHENNFLYYQRMKFRTYHQITTSPHEGTNFGIKTHAASVKPCNTLARAGRGLTLQAELRMLRAKHDAARKVVYRNVWSKSNTSKHIIDNAESILKQIQDRIELYSAKRVGESKWEVRFIGDADDMKHNSGKKKVPNFSRIRKVQLVNGQLVCSCCFFETVGMPCPHEGAVIKFHYPTWNGFSHHDVDLPFWNIYHKYAYVEGGGRNIDLLSNRLHWCRGRIKGPKFPQTLGTDTTYAAESPIKPAAERITNYSHDMVKEILGSTTNQHDGLSQEGNIDFPAEEGWGGLDDEEGKNAHTCYHDMMKYAHHEVCDLLDSIHSTDPVLAGTLHTELKKTLDDFRDKCRAARRCAVDEAAERRGRASLSQRDESSVPMTHNIMAPPVNRLVRRTFNSINSINANPSKRHKAGT